MCLFRVQPDEPGELEAEVESQPVAPAPQVDPGYSFRLLQPVVQRAAVQAEPLGARLRIAGEVEVGLQGRDHRGVGVVEQGGEARVKAGCRLGVSGKLGQGAMGSVYKARQLKLNRLVAIKTLLPRFAANADLLKRLTGEARLAAKLSHNNIVQAIDVGSAGAIHYFVMEHVEGTTIKDELEKGNPPTD